MTPEPPPPPLPPLAAAAILDALDEACARSARDPAAWPRFHLGAGAMMEFAGLRLWAARSPAGWGVALGRLSGGDESEWRTELFLYGSAVDEGLCESFVEAIPLSFSGDGDQSGAIDGGVLEGPAGRLEVTGELVDALDLRPGEGSERNGGGSAMVALRAYLELFPEAIWPEAPSVLAALGLGSEARLLVCTSDFAHVVGRGLAPEDHHARWERRPSESPTWRSLAQVLAFANPALFEPGEVNTSWRDHASHQERLEAAMGHADAGSAAIGAYDDWDDAPAALGAFDGDWRCAELGLAFRLQGCEAVTTAAQAGEPPVGELMLRITRVSPDGSSFAGQMRLSRTRVCSAEGRLLDDDTLEMQAATHTFVLRREVSWSFG